SVGGWRPGCHLRAVPIARCAAVLARRPQARGARAMLSRLAPLPRLLLGLAGILAGLAVMAALWWWWPTHPVARLHIPFDLYGVWLSPSGRILVAINEQEGDTALTVWEVASGRLRTELPLRHPHGFYDKYQRRPLPQLWISPEDSVLVYGPDRE